MEYNLLSNGSIQTTRFVINSADGRFNCPIDVLVLEFHGLLHCDVLDLTTYVNLQSLFVFSDNVHLRIILPTVQLTRLHVEAESGSVTFEGNLISCRHVFLEMVACTNIPHADIVMCRLVECASEDLKVVTGLHLTSVFPQPVDLSNANRLKFLAITSTSPLLGIPPNLRMITVNAQRPMGAEMDVIEIVIRHNIEITRTCPRLLCLASTTHENPQTITKKLFPSLISLINHVPTARSEYPDTLKFLSLACVEMKELWDYHPLPASLEILVLHSDDIESRYLPSGLRYLIVRTASLHIHKLRAQRPDIIIIVCSNYGIAPAKYLFGLNNYLQY